MDFAAALFHPRTKFAHALLCPDHASVDLYWALFFTNVERTIVCEAVANVDVRGSSKFQVWLIEVMDVHRSSKLCHFCSSTVLVSKAESRHAESGIPLLVSNVIIPPNARYSYAGCHRSETVDVIKSAHISALPKTPGLPS